MPEVRVERTGDGFEATNDRGARVAIGDSATDGVFTPVELLLAALGGCELVTVEPLTAQRGHRMVRLAATVAADKIATSRLGTITLTYDVELPEGDDEAHAACWPRSPDGCTTSTAPSATRSGTPCRSTRSSPRPRPDRQVQVVPLAGTFPSSR